MILVYQISSSSSASLKPDVSPVQALSLPSKIWDCKFSKDGALLVLTTEKPHFKRFQKCQDSESSSNAASAFVEIDEALDFSFDVGDDSPAAFEASLETALNAPSLFSVLTKSKIDNMKAYLETKEKRLADGNARWGRKKAGEVEEEAAVADAKKMKAA